MLNYLKNTHPKESRQSLLNLQPAVNASESELNENMGVLSAWKFDQDEIRKAMTDMIVLDELPFKFMEAPGFKKFLVVACPRFKIPSRWTISRDYYSLFLIERSNLKLFLKNHSQRVCFLDFHSEN